MRHPWPVLILLPPSEGKVAPESGARIDIATLSYPTLGAARRKVLAALIDLCRDETAARSVLKLSERQRDEIAQNRHLRTAPAGRAIEVYAGVLYDALDPASLTRTQLQRLNDNVAIASALWGLVRPLDRIPAYRLSGESKLPPFGSLANVWSGPIGTVLAKTDGPIIDLRSGAYQSLAQLPERDEAVVGRVMLEQHGKRSVVSHHNKATKGRITRIVATSRGKFGSVYDFANLLTIHGYVCELHESKRGPARLDIITTAL